jgi:hypothetical protein
MGKGPRPPRTRRFREYLRRFWRDLKVGLTNVGEVLVVVHRNLELLLKILLVLILLGEAVHRLA